MIGLNAGLEIARKALATYQLALGVYSNNIANVNTPGYSRRSPKLEESVAASLSVGRLSLGVDVASIRRMRDRFLDIAYRQEASTLGRYESLDQNLSQIEMVLAEPSDVSLSSALGEFWTSWQELANQPESPTARSLVVDTASSVCDLLHQTDSRLTNLRSNIDDEIRGCVEQVNSMAAQIAAINEKVVAGEASGSEASDLRDQRDSLLDQLSEIAGITVTESQDGSVSVAIGSEGLVERTTVVPLVMARRGDGGVSVTDLRVAGQTRVLQPTNGKLAGLLASRDTVLPRYKAQLDEIARAIVENVNAAHRAGYDLAGAAGGDFFDPGCITASSIRVSSAIIDDSNLIAASSDGSPGDNQNALAIADLRLSGVLGEEDATIDEYYNSLIGSLGIEASAAASDKETESLLVGEVSNRRESVKGVSLDEEMTNLLTAQHAYQAAAKVVSVMDQLMSSLLSTT